MGPAYSPDLHALVTVLRRDGVVMLPGFFPREQAEQARRELEECFVRDRLERESGGVTDPVHDGTCGRTALTPPMHNLVDAWAQSPTLDGMAETLLTHPLTRALAQAMAGGHLKARAFTCRWMSGAYDPPPAHDWHRDAPGAFNFGMLLNDVPAGGHGATGFIRGSHWYPYNPLWNTLFSQCYEGPPIFRKANVFNHALRARMATNLAEASGAQGDAYLFTNELWHGRQPNLHGGRAMVSLLALYPASYAFPSGTRHPSDEVIEQLPPALRAALDPPVEAPIDPSCLIEQIRTERGEPGPFDLFFWARLEHRAAEACGRLLTHPNGVPTRS